MLAHRRAPRREGARARACAWAGIEDAGLERSMGRDVSMRRLKRDKASQAAMLPSRKDATSKLAAQGFATRGSHCITLAKGLLIGGHAHMSIAEAMTLLRSLKS